MRRRPIPNNNKLVPLVRTKEGRGRVTVLLCVAVCYCVLLYYCVTVCYCVVLLCVTDVLLCVTVLLGLCVTAVWRRVKCRADTTGEHAMEDLSCWRMCEFAKTCKTCSGSISFDQAEKR